MAPTSGFLFSLSALVMTATPAIATTDVTRLPGPAGSLIMVEASTTVPLVEITIASRLGAADDPRNLDGLTNFAVELARRGAAGRSRKDIDAQLDALGANIDVLTDLDSVRLVGTVLQKNLLPFLKLLADIVLRPDFAADEFERTRREIRADLDEMRNDDRALAERFFARRLYRRHGYGHAIDGTHDSLARMDRTRFARHHRRLFSGPNVIFAATGAVDPADFQAHIGELFLGLPADESVAEKAGTAPPNPTGWRMQLIDKPDRKQVQIMFGHIGLPATHPDQAALALALASFGGGFMNATLMSELRVQRGMVYGAYMSNPRHRGSGPVRAWMSTGVENAVEAIKLSLRLYKEFQVKGLAPERVKFVRDYLIGAYASSMDSPGQRLSARVSAEIQGLPADHVDTYPERLRAITQEDIARVIAQHIHPDDLAITLVATAKELTALLVAAGIDRGAIDIERYDAY